MTTALRQLPSIRPHGLRTCLLNVNTNGSDPEQAGTRFPRPVQQNFSRGERAAKEEKKMNGEMRLRVFRSCFHLPANYSKSTGVRITIEFSTTYWHLASCVGKRLHAKALNNVLLPISLSLVNVRLQPRERERYRALCAPRDRQRDSVM